MSVRGPVTVDCPLGPEAFAVRSLRGVEELGRPFSYVVELTSDTAKVDLGKLLGLPMTVHVEVNQGQQRHFNGIVTEAEIRESTGGTLLYVVTLRPWLSLLEHHVDCAVFQQLSVPEILKKVFQGQGFTDFDESLTAEYPKRDFVVQYRESDFNFVSRLMEESGIYYFFRHTQNRHVLVLADGPSAHAMADGCSPLPYAPTDAHRRRLHTYVDRFRLTQRVAPSAVSLRDFDFERPNADLSAHHASPKSHGRNDFEVFDYPGSYKDRASGEALARLRLEQYQSPFERVFGHTNARFLAAGTLFALSEHPSDAQNRNYLVVRTEVHVVGHGVRAEGGFGDEAYSSSFEAMDAKVPFRTRPTTKKPLVEGPQTAVVVGKAGEEIWTDKYGRVKVQFHWDRGGNHDENSSCWVRVSHGWAGSHFGTIHTPRIGQEVIVSFLEGDPDRPIITGRVYNGTHMPPYDLPARQTQSGIKTRSSKGGGLPQGNELRFEDKKGEEELFVQAEKDLKLLVKHSETRTIGKDRKVSIDGNDSVSIQGEGTWTVAKKGTLEGKRRLVLASDEEVEIRAGAASITLSNTGTISIKGILVNVDGMATIQLKSGMILLKGAVIM